MIINGWKINRIDTDNGPWTWKFEAERKGFAERFTTQDAAIRFAEAN